jgi:hypothetical protein
MQETEGVVLADVGDTGDGAEVIVVVAVVLEGPKGVIHAQSLLRKPVSIVVNYWD